VTTPETAPTLAGRRPTRCRALRLSRQPITQPNCPTSTLAVSAAAQASPNPATNQPPLNPCPVNASAASSNSQRRGRMRPPQGLRTHGQKGRLPTARATALRCERAATKPNCWLLRGLRAASPGYTCSQPSPRTYTTPRPHSRTGLNYPARNSRSAGQPSGQDVAPAPESAQLWAGGRLGRRGPHRLPQHPTRY